MKRTGLSLASVLLLCAWALPARAIQVYVAPWIANPNDPQWQGGVTTAQGWEFDTDLYNPVFVNNSFGPPTLGFSSTVSPDPVLDFPGSLGTPVDTWHVDDPAGVHMVVSMMNDPIPRPRKVIHLQYTSDKPGVLEQVAPIGTITAGGVTNHGGNWATYEWTVEILPNPSYEQLYVKFDQSTNIEEVWVYTICVPEPANVALLASGPILALAARRRREAPARGSGP